MRDDLDAALCRDFPLLYADRKNNSRTTAMCWGFECGDGWEPLIRKLSESLETLIRNYDGPPEARPRASQVKEKFGTLRFYMTSLTEQMDEAIREAEAESARTCEECGAPGTSIGRHWIKTLCDTHAETYKS